MTACMYNIRPVISHDEPLPAPSHNMYSIKPIQRDGGCDSPATVGLNELNSRLEELLQVSNGGLSGLERRQEEILKRLAQLKIDMNNFRRELNEKPKAVAVTPVSTTGGDMCQSCPELGNTPDVVVYASPRFPPYSLVALASLWGSCSPLELLCHTHSSVKEAPESAALFMRPAASTPCVRVTLVWKDVGPETELITNPVKYVGVRGETNILRFLSRIGPVKFAYEGDANLNVVTQMDEVLDTCQRLARHRTVKEKQALIRSLNANLGKSEWMCGRPTLSIVDVAAWSILKQVTKPTDLTQIVTKWMERCDSMLL